MRESVISRMNYHILFFNKEDQEVRYPNLNPGLLYQFRNVEMRLIVHKGSQWRFHFFTITKYDYAFASGIHSVKE
jgi:hypothetical protein